MNRYPVWKYAIIVIAMLLGVVYTLPNFFGEAPAVQVSSGKATIKVDTGTLQKVEDALKAAGVSAQSVALEGGSIRARFNSTDEQLACAHACKGAGAQHSRALGGGEPVALESGCGDARGCGA
eukprot:gene43504-54040_t